MKAVATLLSLCRVLKEEYEDQIHVCPITDGAPFGTRVVQASTIHQASSGTNILIIFYSFLEIFGVTGEQLTFIDPLTSQPKTLCLKTSIMYVLIVPESKLWWQSFSFFAWRSSASVRGTFQSLSWLLPKFPDFLLCKVSIHLKHFIPNLTKAATFLYFAGL